jgi:DNA-binding MarR family transcriptional regulator
MKITITEDDYLKVWLKLMLLKLHITLSSRELEVLEYICKLQRVSTEERKIIAKELSTSYQGISNTLKVLKDKNLIKTGVSEVRAYNKRSYYYCSNIQTPSNINKLQNWTDNLSFTIVNK